MKKVEVKKFEVFMDKEHVLHYKGQTSDTPESISALKEKFTQTIKTYKPNRYLIDIRSVSLLSAEKYHKELGSMVGELDKSKAKKIGVLVNGKFQEVVTHFVYSRAGINMDKVKFFISEEEALSWLQEK